MIELFTLLILFQLKHFICDYPLQTPYMLGKMKATGWVKPLVACATIHALFTFIISMWFIIITLPSVGFILIPTLLALLDFTIHFVVDRLKASPSIGGRFKPDQPYFWWAFGADQMAHHLTHYLIIFILIGIL